MHTHRERERERHTHTHEEIHREGTGGVMFAIQALIVCVSLLVSVALNRVGRRAMTPTHGSISKYAKHQYTMAYTP